MHKQNRAVILLKLAMIRNDRLIWLCFTNRIVSLTLTLYKLLLVVVGESISINFFFYFFGSKLHA